MMKRHTRLLSFVSAEVDKLDNQNRPAYCHNQNKLDFRIHKVKLIKDSGLGNDTGLEVMGKHAGEGERGLPLCPLK